MLLSSLGTLRPAGRTELAKRSVAPRRYRSWRLNARRHDLLRQPQGTLSLGVLGLEALAYRKRAFSVPQEA